MRSEQLYRAMQAVARKYVSKEITYRTLEEKLKRYAWQLKDELLEEAKGAKGAKVGTEAQR